MCVFCPLIACAQPALDMPELLWKAFIDFEIAAGEVERTRVLYERLLERTKHVKVWISFGAYEQSLGDWAASRSAFNRGYALLKAEQRSEDRVMVSAAWAPSCRVPRCSRVLAPRARDGSPACLALLGFARAGLAMHLDIGCVAKNGTRGLYRRVDARAGG